MEKVLWKERDDEYYRVTIERLSAEEATVDRIEIEQHGEEPYSLVPEITATVSTPAPGTVWFLSDEEAAHEMF